jgi:hypothetical protein
MTKTMPPLPSGSVDLDALHKADAKGADLAKAIEAATSLKQPAPPSKAEPAPAKPPAEPDAG